MRSIFQTSQFKRDIKRLKKRGKPLDKLGDIVKLIANDATLEEKHRDHALTGNWAGSRDCHVEPDWILIYRCTDEALFLERSGTHSELFK
jgi:mRNA interferase YafQ